ncbi:MAG TPA: hypothetical protein IAB37_09865 [Candidatus Faecivivens stercoravium]|uniref:Uncharacterized protein n=1 Tax=Candidatus Faecivivens stercoravium TaxID=2840803 RepID=A0A9D1J5P2_9FIRM|nr:hypothetical protein [Candidatus Faecivivens stercoravium]
MKFRICKGILGVFIKKSSFYREMGGGRWEAAQRSGTNFSKLHIKFRYGSQNTCESLCGGQAAAFLPAIFAKKLPKGQNRARITLVKFPQKAKFSPAGAGFEKPRPDC